MGCRGHLQSWWGCVFKNAVYMKYLVVPVAVVLGTFDISWYIYRFYGYSSLHRQIEKSWKVIYHYSSYRTWHDFSIFSPNSVSTLRGSCGKGKGRCLIEVLTLGRGIFPVNFCIKWLFLHVHVNFDCAGSHKVWAVSFACSWSAAFCL